MGFELADVCETWVGVEREIGGVFESVRLTEQRVDVSNLVCVCVITLS